MSGLVIAIDFDDTFTADEMLWSEFIKAQSVVDIASTV